MKVACVCCTYNRPRELANAVACYLQQDYPAELRELVILDDAGQYDLSHGLDATIHLVSTSYRFRTLGEKRNASVGLVSSDVEAICVWDDDDSYLPWHISAHVEALQRSRYVIPTTVYIDRTTQLARRRNTYLYHGGWSFQRSAFSAVGGYPFIQSGQDQGLLKRFKYKKFTRGDTLQVDVRPSYIYSWFTSHNKHISAGARNSYENLGLQTISLQTALRPKFRCNWEQLQLSEQNAYNTATT